MIYLKLLLILYASCMLLWSLVLIWYLNRALIEQRQPAWLRTIIQNGSVSEFVLYGSVLVSPIFIVFSFFIIMKKFIRGILK